MKIFWPKSAGRTASFFWCFLVYAGEKIPSHWDVGTQKLQNSVWWQENESVNEQFWVWRFCILIEEFLLKIQAFHIAKISILVIDQNLGQPRDPMCPLGAHSWLKAGLHIAGKTPGKEGRGASLLQNLKWSQLWESEMSVQAPSSAAGLGTVLQREPHRTAPPHSELLHTSLRQDVLLLECHLTVHSSKDANYCWLVY